MITPEDQAFRDWVARAKAAPIAEAARIAGFRPNRGEETRAEPHGPCPACGGHDRFHVKMRGARAGLFHCRHCGGGHGPISLVMKGLGVDFREACARLAGPPPGQTQAAPRELTVQEAKRLGRQAFAEGAPAVPPASCTSPWLARCFADGHAAAAREAARFEAARAHQREELYAQWCAGLRISDPAAQPLRDYLTFRGLGAVIPHAPRLRLALDMPYFAEVRQHPMALWRGPAMLAAIQANDGGFMGLHITWLKPDGRGRPVIAHPETGEVLKTKKMRGAARGGSARLLSPAGGDVMMIGEGIETVLGGWLLLPRANGLRTHAVAALSLGNLGGPAARNVAHPTGMVQRRRRDGTLAFAPLMLPGPEPGSREDWPHIAAPEGVKREVILGDGDSEPFLTRCAVERRRRFALAQGREALSAMADTDRDWCDMHKAHLETTAPRPEAAA